MGSAPRTPSTVLRRIGHTHPIAITNTFIDSPNPNTSMAKGRSAGGGMARRNSVTGPVVRRTTQFEPINNPAPIPTTAAIV